MLKLQNGIFSFLDFSETFVEGLCSLFKEAQGKIKL